MIELTISDKDPAQVKLKERLEEMCLARHLIVDMNCTQPMLLHDKKVYNGVSEIEAYLFSLEDFIEEWYACRCDKYFVE